MLGAAGQDKPGTNVQPVPVFCPDIVIYDDDDNEYGGAFNFACFPYQY